MSSSNIPRRTLQWARKLMKMITVSAVMVLLAHVIVVPYLIKPFYIMLVSDPNKLTIFDVLKSSPLIVAATVGMTFIIMVFISWLLGRRMSGWVPICTLLTGLSVIASIHGTGLQAQLQLPFGLCLISWAAIELQFSVTYVYIDLDSVRFRSDAAGSH